MEIKELIEKYSEDILDEANQNRQNEAMINVVTIISNEMGQKLENIGVDNLSGRDKKREMKRILQETNDKYILFVGEINKLAGKELLKPDGMINMFKKKIKL